MDIILVISVVEPVSKSIYNWYKKYGTMIAGVDEKFPITMFQQFK